jgi:hypothetical protein
MKPVKNKPIDQETYLSNLLNDFSKLQIASKSKIEKYKDLMQRNSSKKWDSNKKKKMQERLQQAEIEYSQSFEIIDQIKLQLNKENS